MNSMRCGHYPVEFVFSVVVAAVVVEVVVDAVVVDVDVDVAAAPI